VFICQTTGQVVGKWNALTWMLLALGMDALHAMLLLGKLSLFVL
jgi:hypothetical protein